MCTHAYNQTIVNAQRYTHAVMYPRTVFTELGSTWSIIDCDMNSSMSLCIYEHFVSGCAHVHTHVSTPNDVSDQAFPKL